MDRLLGMHQGCHPCAFEQLVECVRVPAGWGAGM